MLKYSARVLEHCINQMFMISLSFNYQEVLQTFLGFSCMHFSYFSPFKSQEKAVSLPSIRHVIGNFSDVDGII